MKKLLLSLLLVFTFIPLFAQSYDPPAAKLRRKPHPHQLMRSEVWAGIGAGALFNVGGSIHGDYSINIGYAEQMLKNFYVGGSIAVSSDDTYNDFNFSVYIRHNWINTRYFSMYYRIGLGGTIVYATGPVYPNICSGNMTSYVAASFQITPIGFEVGYNHVWFYMDFGLGYDGMINSGVRVRF